MKKFSHLFAALLIVVFVLIGAASPYQGGGRITEISLERTACFGTCPIYEVILRSDGTATYVGKRFAQRIGTYKGRIPRRDFNRLAALLNARNFFALKNRYAVPATDLPTAITEAVRGGVRKRVENYGASSEGVVAMTVMGPADERAPAELHEIEKAIDAAASRIRWVKVSDSTESPGANH